MKSEEGETEQADDKEDEKTWQSKYLDKQKTAQSFRDRLLGKEYRITVGTDKPDT